MEPKVSASPVLANGHIYFLSENGNCFIIKADPKNYELVAEVKVGDSAFATPSFVDDKIFFRIARFENGKRQEYLTCVGNGK